MKAQCVYMTFTLPEFVFAAQPACGKVSLRSSDNGNNHALPSSPHSIDLWATVHSQRYRNQLLFLTPRNCTMQTSTSGAKSGEQWFVCGICFVYLASLDRHVRSCTTKKENVVIQNMQVVVVGKLPRRLAATQLNAFTEASCHVFFSFCTCSSGSGHGGTGSRLCSVDRH